MDYLKFWFAKAVVEFGIALAIIVPLVIIAVYVELKSNSNKR